MIVRYVIDPSQAQPLPQCEATRITPYARDKEGHDRQCTRKALYMIDGRKLCTQHASKIVLDAVIAGELISKAALEAAKEES